MAMFEVEGQSKVIANDCTTTAETLIKSTGSTSTLDAKATNCHSGVNATPDKPAEPSFGRKAFTWSAEAAIKAAVTGLLSALATAVLYYWEELKKILT